MSIVDVSRWAKLSGTIKNHLVDGGAEDNPFLLKNSFLSWDSTFCARQSAATHYAGYSVFTLITEDRIGYPVP
jgi:hypothetical protein